MTPKERAAMQQALEALDASRDDVNECLNDALDKDSRRLIQIYTDQLEKHEAAITALREALAEQAECKECGAKQAQIDRLMLEYCPDEMTHEQMQEWGNNQRPAEQEKQEPVAWGYANKAGQVIKCVPVGSFQLDRYKASGFDTPLYAAPVRTKDLTDDEIDQVAGPFPKKYKDDFYYFARAVIAADREKNRA